MNRKIAMLLAGAGLLSGMTAVFAQSMDGFDPDAIEARADQFREDAQALFEYATTNAETHTEEAQAVVQQGQQSIEGLDVSQIAGGQGPFDFDEMVAGAKAGMAKPEGAPLFIAFASLSMPEEALSKMIEDTTKAGGVVVFRGFSAGNPQGFIQGIRKVVDQAGASNVAIDPRLFRSFGVDRVPTYVALSSDFEPCDQLDCVTAPPPHDRIAGNVSVSYVLESFANANGPGAPVSRLALRNMKGAR
ncbi:type-F conjugative transfer system pilin assembly protein TrbC [Ponticaulis sp.]|jgi:conjugal transfer pilus assembly protein TrbC|uniref:type-F conjugative transfer system pilin assembly protein TrbC n=1 Tax=Ponticaulis sp. TaxID=2020902 RepID=UPI000C3E4637|nr:type-F conjugative transfer system pilin assembly protein TrbC [Ponticaulis sp.]MBN05563.1 type-F conjugative transfer system pilin assembly protein TrbC [Ponticaulis sp.]NDR57424.1 type-F conjugative transfer system pilin assembly protein TrbC [Pseudoruegeria sp. M32A2M]|tara:strand:+ start:410 stop:1147 length:738 start_codon:yes stop_codon:yes gene_type:complete